MSLTNLAVRVGEPAAEGEHLRLEIEADGRGKGGSRLNAVRGPSVGHASSRLD